MNTPTHTHRWGYMQNWFKINLRQICWSNIYFKSRISRGVRAASFSIENSLIKLHRCCNKFSVKVLYVRQFPPTKKKRLILIQYKTCKFITKMIWKHYGKNEDQTHSYRNEWQKKIRIPDVTNLNKSQRGVKKLRS